MNAQRKHLVALLATFGFVLAGASLPAMAEESGEAAEVASSPHADLLAGVQAAQDGDFETAIRLLESVVRRDGLNNDAYAWLAYAAWRRAEQE
jgi:hypothetical protein